jgi:hypothetical protein
MKKGKYYISFEVDFEEDDDGRDIGARFIEGVLSDVEETHRLICNNVKIKEDYQ